MAELLLPLNGIGHGHLTRALIFADWLREAERRPMLVLQGSSGFKAAASVPTSNIPPLYRLSPSAAQRIAEDLCNCARLSAPPVIVEDTHVAPVRWPNDVHHVLIVRPTQIEHMRLLNHRYGGNTARILICDHPDSPVWPFDPSETQEISAWPGWKCLGPVFRSGSVTGMREVRQRRRLHPADEVFVFSMGGGGERPGSGDRVAFIRAATTVAEEIRRSRHQARFLFIRGPLFPAELPLPSIFEDIAEERDLPSLLRIARGAIVRPGYNIVWECIVGRTPFITIAGTTFAEPVDRRLSTLAAHGLATSLDVDRLLDETASRHFSVACDTILSRFDGAPRDVFLATTTTREAASTRAAKVPAQMLQCDGRSHLASISAAIRAAPARVPLRLRLDDVTRLDAEVDWLLTLCCELRLHVSLEVVPYHSTLTGAELDRLDPGGLCDVAQHGYSHLPTYDSTLLLRGEFLREYRFADAVTRLRLGAARLRDTFGSRFRGGYSAPYDVLPRWLPSAWKEAGGRYISWIWNSPMDGSLPTVPAGIEPWDWPARRPSPLNSVCADLVAALQQYGALGIVLHPQCLGVDSHRREIELLLKQLTDLHCISTRMDPCEGERWTS